MIRLPALAALVAIAAIPALSGTAHAQRVSKINGKTLGTLCASGKTAGVCDAYLAGVMDSAVWSKDYDTFAKDAAAPVAFCVPTGQTGAQVRGVVVAWLRAHEDALTQPAGKGVYRALHENYPCGSGGEERK